MTVLLTATSCPQEKKKGEEVMRVLKQAEEAKE